jgi:hypothetical protein
MNGNFFTAVTIFVLSCLLIACDGGPLPDAQVGPGLGDLTDDDAVAELVSNVDGSAASQLQDNMDPALVTAALGLGDGSALNPRRSLIETNIELLAPLTLEAVLHLIAENAGLIPTAALSNNLIFNLYNDSNLDVFPGIPQIIPHAPCDDPRYREITNNYPYQCPRAEGSQAIGSVTSSPAMADWEGIALVNRVDMAPASGQHCGEQRLIMARTSGATRNLLIFEAQIPNPDADGSPCACAPIAKFWKKLSKINDIPTRQRELGMAFFFGHPALRRAGFKPFMTAENFSIGTGQVRSNNFIDGPWSLREMKLVGWNQIMFPIPIPVTGNLHAPLLADSSVDPRSPMCKQAFLDSIPKLLAGDVNTIALDVPEPCWDGESPNDFSQGNYNTHINASASPTFFARVQDNLSELGSSITPGQLAQRATFAGSCIGCHQEANFADLGGGLTAPPSAFFVHVAEFGQEDCGDGTLCWPISDALSGSFLPFRANVMEGLLDSCTPREERRIARRGRNAPAPSVFDVNDALLPDGSLDVEALSSLDEAKKAKGDTIGGTPAARVH